VLTVLAARSRDSSWWRRAGLDPLSIQSLKTIIYLKVSLSDFLTLFAARCRGPFYSIAPSGKLVAAATLAMGLSTTFAATWPFGEDLAPLPVATIVVVWSYVLGWWLVQDAAKVLFYKWKEAQRRAGEARAADVAAAAGSSADRPARDARRLFHRHHHRRH
jgi:H+-transporting ATPase